MDYIDKIIKDGTYEKIHLMKLKHKWRDFYNAIKNSNFFMFGVGDGANLYFFEHGDFLKVDMVVDNNKNIQGLPFQLFTAEHDYKDEKLIESPSVLKKYKNSNPIVLITSLKHCDEIASELDKYGIKRYFSVLCMEIAKRLSEKSMSLLMYKEEWLNRINELPVSKNKICIVSHCDGAGHAKEIVHHLTSRRNDLDIVWLVNDLHVNLPCGVRKRLISNPYSYEYEYRTAAIWLGDGGGGGLPMNINKKPEQICIELKHWSSVTLKKFALDEGGVWRDNLVRESIEKTSRLIDVVMVGSEFDERTCRSGLGVEGEYVRVGSPRSDILFKKNRKKTFLNQFPHLYTKKLLLYAPTFRRTGKDMSEIGYLHELDFENVRNALAERFGGEWIILLRLHPLVAKYSSEIKVPDYVLDVSNYPDSEELVAASDALITDYSSIMFESAYVEQPVFLFATDVIEYTSKEREFYIPLENLPFSIASDNRHLVENIISFDTLLYKNNLKNFFDKYGVHEDGHAAERAADFIIGLIDKEVSDRYQ